MRNKDLLIEWQQNRFEWEEVQTKLTLQSKSWKSWISNPNQTELWQLNRVCLKFIDR